ncbi:LysM-like peptidoglycan-binding domain-containing protein [Vibrio sp. B1FLJ16]|uniref:LysM-like peptidoglycan-binding domain-containing protein n=1 Tax=Vibrio sp. B1FLJ16 TaxID=2751178 RepID=UPI0015F3D17B|nr:LysM-like peptidoglycan-binding domain-containing protein [Vibrio sp. B1FLJ16]MCA0935230.1 lysine transporter LysM [Vibrio alginolyticus]CAD7798014.1 COG3061 Cell envelope opacity-associated protein A [Vibrio sp. B1FLJ16]CAD7798051.1 COG3061 Cell envelope opacity-associated protein A [Vibrio sp. B1FLJ16]CAE6881739.1 COG3061 Cell envelope opacity-associated protein A [Vibrio sp. B1FLJ16]CAE6882515.1 COG3061 Cell envelope opacity-associated protein A [Vibrio sp. B1FLJ16]
MNRRRKKKQQVDYVELIKQKFAAIDWKQPFNKDKQSENAQPVPKFWQRLPKFHQRALMVLVPLFLLLLIVPLPKKTEESAEQNQPADQQRVSIELNAQSLSQQRTSQNSGPKSENWKEYQVKNGDTLAQVFRSNQLSMADLSSLVKIEGSDKPLSHIKQGQLIRFKFSDEGDLDMLQLEKGDHSVMFFRLSDGSFGRNK